jgi:hypothetical protein
LLVIEVLTAVFTAWPVPISLALIVCILGSVLLLRASASSFIGRLRRLKLPGASLDAGGAEQRQSSPPATPSSDALLKREAETAPKKDPRAVVDDVLRHLPRTEYFAMREVQLEVVLNQLGISEDPQQAVRVLIALTASASIGDEFERLYNIVWGSQLRILQALNSAPQSTPVELLRPIYDEAAAVYPAMYRDYAFEAYIAFMLTTEIIAVNEGKASITLKGRTFLTYLVHDGKSLDRTG